MARSKQTNAAATPATASVRRTQASPPANEDPPAQGSRRPRTSNAAKSTRNNQATQHNDDDDQPEEVDEQALRAEIQADVRAISTAAEASARRVQVTILVQDLEDEPLGRARDANLERARFESAMLRQRHGELRSALPTAASSSNNNPGHVSKGKATSPQSGHSVLSAPAAGSGGQDATENDFPPPPPRRSTRRRGGWAPRSAADVQDPAAAETGGTSQNSNTTVATTWRHQPGRRWKLYGIIDENEDDDLYLIVWRPTKNGTRTWANSWEKRSFANAKAVRDWNRRKGIEELREYVDGVSEMEYV